MDRGWSRGTTNDEPRSVAAGTINVVAGEDDGNGEKREERDGGEVRLAKGMGQ